MIDLRSDTVTRPCPSMRQAMAQAEVGDDVYGEDPTVNQLEALFKGQMDKEAALFVTSGTQANLLAMLSHCDRGDEFIAGQTAHAYRFEAGGAAVLGGLQPQPLTFNDAGELPLDDIRAAIKPDNIHFARTRLVCIENTKDGTPLERGYLNDVAALCSEQGLRLHMDGARLFNAAVAQSCDAAELARECDSVSVCLSKGLGAPVGSLLVGSSEFIERARRYRKMLGGGMRQAGILAAAGIFALQNNVTRLADDHQHAAEIATTLEARFPGGVRQATNMVFLDIDPLELKRLLAHMNEHGVLLSRERWVLHRDVSAQDVQTIIAAITAF